MNENAPRASACWRSSSSGDDLDRDVPRQRVLLELAQHGPAEHVGQEHVERYGRRLELLCQFQRIDALGRNQNLEALLVRKVGEDLRVVHVVLDDQQDLNRPASIALRSSATCSTRLARGVGAFDDRAAQSSAALPADRPPADWTRPHISPADTGEGAALPGVLRRWISPPSSEASSRLMARPRPVPPYLRLVEASACWNASKMMRCLSSGMPMPVSATSKAMTPHRTGPAPDASDSSRWSPATPSASRRHGR